ncbi:MAG: hypothetical protein RL196_1372 [Actinomycetota bacterium]|jgi:hypothetical protein
MGRGRQKAKHTKVARELKYFSPNTDYNALERELGTVVPGGSGEPDYEDKWADLYGDEDGEDEGEDDADDSDTDSASAAAGVSSPDATGAKASGSDSE